MIAKPLAINQTGIETVLWFSENPARLEENDQHELSGQRYVPGISVPGIAELEKPFNVPILGDEEAVSLSINWPRATGGFPYIFKQATLTWQLPDGSVTRGPALNRSTLEEQMDADLEAETADEAFDEYVGDFGAIVQVRADKREVLIEDGTDVAEVSSGSAELYVIETLDEFDAIKDALRRYRTSASEIVMATRGLRFAVRPSATE